MGALLEVSACRQARKIRRQARKFDCFDPAMFLNALWVSFRLILYVLGNLLGLSWAPLGCSWVAARADQHKNTVHDHCLFSASSSSSSSSSSTSSSASSLLSSSPSCSTSSSSAVSHSSTTRDPQAWGSWLRTSHVGQGRRVPRKAYNMTITMTRKSARGRQ